MQYYRKLTIAAILIAVSAMFIVAASSTACCLCCREKAAGCIHKHDEFSAENCPQCAKGDGLCSYHKMKQSGCTDCKKCLEDPIVNTKGLEVLMMSNVKLVILDARSADSYAKAHIPGAVNISPKASEDDINQAVGKSDLIVVYCAGLKCPMSHRLDMRLHDLGHHNVIEYPYGMECWVATGNTVEGSEAEPIKQPQEEKSQKD